MLPLAGYIDVQSAWLNAEGRSALRLTLINQFYPPDVSPTGRLTASLAAHRAALGDHVTVIASQGYVAQSKSEPHTDNAHICIKRLWTPQLGKRTIIHRCLDYIIFYFSALWVALRIPRQDVVICLTTPPFIVSVGVFHKLIHRKTKLILWNMDCYPEVLERTKTIQANGIIYRSISLLNRFISSHADHIVCLDSSMRDLVQARNDSKQCPVSIIPNWEPIDSFPLPPIADRSHGEAERPFTILYSGNMGHGHCFETLLNVAKIMKTRTPAIQFVMTGGGVQADTIRQRILKEQLDNVAFEGYVSAERLRLIQRMSHCALITLKDSMLGCMSPSKLHASLAMGLPILYLGPPGSNIDDAVNAYECGISLRQGDTRGVVAALEMLASSPDIWHVFL